MAAVLMQSKLPWSKDERTERRFASILLAFLLPILLLSMILPWLPLLELPSDEDEDQTPPRLAELVVEEREPPPPEPVEEPEPEEPVEQPEPQPEPQPQQTERASQQRAEDTGVMAFADELESLRENSPANSISAQRNLSQGAAEGETERKLITSDIGEGSTGIQSESGTPGALGGGTELVGRNTTEVEGPPGGGAVAGGSGRSGTGGQAKRSLESIQVVFDRNKSSLYSIYQRALRSNPGLQGTIVLRLEIQPSGEVSSASVVSSELNDDELESKILNRVRLMNFGAKEVPVWRGEYPIRFFPS